MKKIILVGGFSEIIELCEDLNYEIVGIIDSKQVQKPYQYKLLGEDKDAPAIKEKFPDIPVVVVPDPPAVRKKLIDHYKGLGFAFESLISKKATISRYASFGEGVIVANGVYVSSNVIIGNYVRLNVNCNIMHDCNINDFSTVAPNAVLLGHVVIKESVYIGSNATILPTTIIEHHSTVGAGAVVTRNVPANKVVKGVPAK